MGVGLELEFVSPSFDRETLLAEFLEIYKLERYIDVNKKRNCGLYDNTGKIWSIYYDRSINTHSRRLGYELVTPVLSTEEDWKFLELWLNFLLEEECFTNETCGMHVHFDCPSNVGKIQTLLLNVCRRQVDLLNYLGVSSYRSKKYCKLFPSDFVKKLEKYSFSCLGDLMRLYHESLGEDMKDESMWMDSHHPSRYYILNLNSILKHNTVEFRLFNGTLSMKDIKSNVEYANSLWL